VIFLAASHDCAVQVEQAVPGTGGLRNVGEGTPVKKMLFTGEYVVVFCTNTIVGWRKDMMCCFISLSWSHGDVPRLQCRGRDLGTLAVCSSGWEACRDSVLYSVGKGSACW